jgi:hypothetical protein
MPGLILMQQALDTRIARIVRFAVGEIALQIEPELRPRRQRTVFEIEADIDNPDSYRAQLPLAPSVSQSHRAPWRAG